LEGKNIYCKTGNSYYNKYRTHLGIDKDSPEGRPVQIVGKIDKIPVANGLHHVYFRKAA
jgi:hypothetical protein